MDDTNNKDHPWKDQKRIEKEDASKTWGILLFGLIGATVTTFAVGHMRSTAEWFYNQLAKSQSAWKRGSAYSNFRKEAWERYNRRMQEEYEEEMERVERIRRMQNVFNRERNKFRKGYESWRENGPGAYQNFQRDDWYWKTDPSYQNRRTNSRTTVRESGHYSLSHHYTVLGLDRSRANPYSDAEIKMAFRKKAKEYHPDQNQENKDAAEAKFKEVMMSYEAIKLERRNLQY